MSNKVYSPREAAIAVLKKTEELLKKSEVLSKYETENSKKVGYKPSKLGAEEKQAEKSDDAFKVERNSAKSSKDPRQAEQIAPGKNPKEKAEGNNKPDGMEPRYEFKDEVKEELKKENAAHMDKSEMKKKYEGFKAVEESAKKSGASDPAAVAAAAGRKKYGKEAFQAAAAKGKKMGKAEKGNYPKELASKDIEENMKHKDQWPGGKKQAVAVGINEARAGKDVSKSEDSFKPIKHTVSSKLAKFMEWKHATKKAKEAAPKDESHEDSKEKFSKE